MTYGFVLRTLVRFEYHGLARPGKGLVKRFIEKVTGFSRAQVTRLVRQHRRTGGIREPPPQAPGQRLSAPLHSTGSSKGAETTLLFWTAASPTTTAPGGSRFVTG